MNGNKASTLRAALGLTAVAMAAMTMVALVVLPAELGAAGADRDPLAAADAAANSRIELAFRPARADAPDRAERNALDCAALGVQALPGKHLKSGSHS